jgi:hypothetical protein
MVKWLNSVSDYGQLNMRVNKDYPFRKACEYGHSEIVQWLINKEAFSNTAKNNYALRHACKNGHLRVVQILYEVEDYFDGFQDNNFAFKHACENGHLELAKWMHSVNDMDIPLQKLNKNIRKHPKIVEWLNSIEGPGKKIIL